MVAQANSSNHQIHTFRRSNGDRIPERMPSPTKTTLLWDDANISSALSRAAQLSQESATSKSSCLDLDATGRDRLQRTLRAPAVPTADGMTLDMQRP